MAIWAIPSDKIILYEPNGDDVDSFSQKVKFCLEEIFVCLQHLHRNGAAASLDGESTPYEIRVNTADNCIYMRNADNTGWLLLGEVADHFGITPETIQAVRNGGGMKRLLMGAEADMPTEGNSTFDLYFAEETSRVFIWTGSTWRKFLSLNFADMLNYERYCIARDEVAYSGADKILRLDSETGKANVDITGSPERILGYLIDVQELGDGHVLVFNAEKQKFVNLPNYELTRADTTYQGGVDNVDKLIRISSDGKIHADITGSANKIDGINIEAEEISDGQILQYSVIRNAFVPVEKDKFTDADVTTTGEAGKLVKVSVDGLIHANVDGSASEIAHVPVNLTGIREGYVLAYVKGKFVPVKKDEIDESSATTTGEANKYVKVGEDGKIHADITGSAEALSNVPLAVENIEDGQILVYHEATNTFRNGSMSAVGVGKSLILLDGERVLGDYNGGTTVSINLQDVLRNSSISREVEHLMRLTENLYIALDAAELNPSGYDNLSGETFYGNFNDIDTTVVDVASVIQGDDSIDVETIEGLVEGGCYVLSDGVKSTDVRIKHIIVEGDTNRVVLASAISEQFLEGRTRLIRSTGEIYGDKMYGDGTVFVTNPIPFANEATGEEISISRAHLTVKHENVADAQITAEIALRETAKFVKGEVIGIGDGHEQTVQLAHTNDLTAYKFAVYFDGVETDEFFFSPISGQVTFTAPSGTIVTADYFYDWGAENFVEMTKTGTYPDRRNSERATTQFSYTGNVSGKVATLRLTLTRGEGESLNEIVSIGTGNPRGFKLAHQAISNLIWIVPANAPWEFIEPLNAVIITAPIGDTIRISYQWRGKEFAVNSFACTFNE